MNCSKKCYICEMEVPLPPSGLVGWWSPELFRRQGALWQRSCVLGLGRLFAARKSGFLCSPQAPEVTEPRDVLGRQSLTKGGVGSSDGQPAHPKPQAVGVCPSPGSLSNPVACGLRNPRDWAQCSDVQQMVAPIVTVIILCSVTTTVVR